SPSASRPRGRSATSSKKPRPRWRGSREFNAGERVATVSSMTEPPAHVSDPSLPPLKPADEREFTLSAVLVALGVTVLIGATFPYIVLKIGFGPNIAVVSAFFGYLALRTFQRKRSLRWQSNLA